MVKTEQEIFEEKTYGQVAYERYVEVLNGTGPDGNPLPTWEALQAGQQNAWNMAGNAAYEKVPKKEKLTDAEA